MDKIVKCIMDSDKWPSISLPENLEILNEIADESYSQETFSGMLSAMLMYHQILEAMCVHLLTNCHFLIKLSVYPSKIEFKIPENKMFGYYISELEKSVSFQNKEKFIGKAKEFNQYRTTVVHEMRRKELYKLTSKLKRVKDCFDELFSLYDEIQDDFRVIFHDLKKDNFDDYFSDEEYEMYFE